MFRVVAYWCIMMVSVLFVLMPSIIETLFDVDELPSFLLLSGLIVSTLGMYRAVVIFWCAGRRPTPPTTARHEQAPDIQRLSRKGAQPPVPEER